MLAGDKLIIEMHLRQPGFTYSACGRFTKHRGGILKIRETGNFSCSCRNELDKACFSNDASYSNSKDLAERTIWDKTLKYRAYEIAINSKYDGYQRGLGSMVYKFFWWKRFWISSHKKSGSRCKWSTSSRITQTCD